MKKHEWRETMPDGDVRYFTATRQAAKWQFKCKLKSEEDWTKLDPPSLEDLEELRDIIWNKSQRRRVPLEHVAEIDALIKIAKRYM